VAHVAEEWFLKIDGIEGASTVAAHKGAIDVLSWSWGVHTGSGGSGSGSGSGKAQFEDFEFVARIDSASPSLFLACATGAHFPSAELTGARTTGKNKAAGFLTYTLSDVSITAVEHGDADSGAPIEQFSLDYKKIEMSFIPRKSSGKLGTPLHAGFDVGQNKKL
jgi:type VI secretion system secreted protein Hcp